MNTDTGLSPCKLIQIQNRKKARVQLDGKTDRHILLTIRIFESVACGRMRWMQLRAARMNFYSRFISVFQTKFWYNLYYKNISLFYRGLFEKSFIIYITLVHLNSTGRTNNHQKLIWTIRGTERQTYNLN